MAQVKDRDQIRSKRKALIALFPYAVWLERDGYCRMFDAYFDIFTAPELRKIVAEPIVMLLDEASPNSPNWVVTLMLPCEDWQCKLTDGRNAVAGWAGAALAVSYTEELGRNVVDSLLNLAAEKSLQPLIPVDIWAWLKKRPSLPPICTGRYFGTEGCVVRRIRELGDVELLESYFLLVWSEWNFVWDTGEMCISIREDFGGIGMWRHREILIKRLDHVLGELDWGAEHLKQQHPYLHGGYIRGAKRDYVELKDVLLAMDWKALAGTPSRLITMFDLLTPARISAESHSTFSCALPLPCP